VNRPLNLPTLKKLIDKLNLSELNVLGFVWTDDCSIEVRYFALIHHSNNDNSRIQFSFGCDLSSRRSPSWDLNYIQLLQKQAKQERKTELPVHEGVFDSFIQCLALFSDTFKLQGIRIKINTNTSTTIETIPLPIKEIFEESCTF
jgi:hypothetical protein